MKRIGSFRCPYAVLISRILCYFGVDTQEEVVGFVEVEFEVKTKVLSQMVYIKSEEAGFNGLRIVEKIKQNKKKQKKSP